eukprot:COSAG01_NODE_62545_length_284_cov_0.616216_1_plen_26_part_10
MWAADRKQGALKQHWKLVRGGDCPVD